MSRERVFLGAVVTVLVLPFAALVLALALWSLLLGRELRPRMDMTPLEQALADDIAASQAGRIMPVARFDL